MVRPGSPLYWRLSSYYFFYFGALGAFLPYWGLYLKERGFDSVAIGQLMAIVAGTKIVAPYIWGWLADRSGQRIRMIRYAAFSATFVFAGVFAVTGFAGMALVMLLFGFFWNAGLPQFEAITLNFLGDDHHRYSTIRAWGSIGFILTVLGLGVLLDARGMDLVPFALLPLYAGIWLSTLAVPKSEQAAQDDGSESRSIGTVLGRRPVQVVLFSAFLMQLSFGVYYTFFSIYLEAEGFSKTAVGLLWVLGVVAEIVVFWYMHRLLLRFKPKTLLLTCLALAAVRWLLIAHMVHVWPLLLFAQLLHAFTFGMFHAVMIHLIHRYFRGVHQGRGQALYSSLSFGAGAAFGSLGSGYFWDAYGSAVCFTAAAVIAAVGLFTVALGFRNE